ncbi:Major facilitator superfamily transporter [Paramyrothecium foliicola]|nr:Major facilitator superfamily transporter [Paramyrothecium foliicola]
MRYDRISSDDEAGQGRNNTEGAPRLSTTVGNSVVGEISRRNDNGNLPPQVPAPKSNKPVAWRDLPRKDQLCIITLARVSEPLVQTSLQAYLYYQLKWFDPSLPDSTISSQAGVLHASFMGAQFCTAMLWGRIADSPRGGRKVVLLVGLLGTCLSCLGFGFSTGFWQAMLFRTLGGATNGNIGVMRTMISEIIREKRFQSRAFLLLPMTFNIGVIIGPILGGILSDPAASYPSLFGKVKFFLDFPYALPNIVSAMFLFLAAVAVWLGLEETHDVLRDLPPDLGIRTWSRIAALFRKRFSRMDSGPYSSVPTEDVELVPETPTTKPKSRRYTQTLPFRRIFTRNVVLTLFAYFLFAFHIGTCNALYFVFLSTPVWDPKDSKHGMHLPFHFTGGLGLQPREVGIAMAILGVIGIAMQILLYPTLSARLGTIRSWRLFLLCFPVAYFLMPYLAVVPSTSPPPAAKTGPLVWLAISSILFVQVSGRTFSLPANTILVNNCSPHPSVLGSVHGIGQSVSSAARTIGPMVGGVVFGYGLNHGVVGLVWWALAAIAVGACLASLLVREGNGHEIWLEGDEEDEQ